MTPRKPQRGGKRQGAGRPTEATGPTRRVNVTLDDATLEILRRVGSGNVSEGIRLLAARAEAAG